MNCITQEKISALQGLIDGASKVVVLGHTHPDGDALGSTAALCLYLQDICRKSVICAFPDTPPENLQFILPTGITYRFQDREPAQTEATIREANLVVLLDCNAFSRTESLAPFLEASQAPKVLIDHHLNPDSKNFKLVFSTPDISSASELLYWVLKALGESVSPAGASALFLVPGGDTLSPRAKSTVEIGTALLTGMTTDTNNFANSVYPSTLQMASELIAAGVNRDAVLERIYQSYRENRVRLMGYMQYEGLHILPNGTSYMILTRDILQRFDLKEGESEGLVNVPLTIGKVRLSVLLKEENDHFRVSVRSKKGTSAQGLAFQYFHGGGHENAAGGKILIGADIPSAQDAPQYLENILKAYLP